MLAAIDAARHRVSFETYVYNSGEIADRFTAAFEAAARRGVRIRILMESDITDAKPVKFASRAAYEGLLEQGIEVYEYVPAMMHAKASVIDGLLSIVGSANFDNRSLELNDELNVAVFDSGLAARLTADFDQDLEKSLKIDLDSWRSRPLHIRGREKLWSYFGEVF